MNNSNILQFLALATFMLVFAEAHYPYSQQYYSNNQHHHQQQQVAYSYYTNGNSNSANNHNNINNNNNNNLDYANANNNNINSESSKSINDYIKSNRRNEPKKNPLVALNLPKVYLGDFEYVPTPNGYRFSYDRADGTRHTEVGIIPDSENTGIYKQDDGVQGERLALRMRGREMSKNRKLSPKSLQSLAG